MDSDSDSSSLIFVVLGAVSLFLLLSWSERSEPNLKHIPAFGHAGYLLSYIDALRFAFNDHTVLQRGYEKHRAGIFKVATLQRWLVIVNGTQFMEELRKAPEEEISLVDTPSELDILAHLSGYFDTKDARDEARNITRDITQNLPFLIPEIADEMQSSSLATSAEGWKEIDLKDLVSQLMIPTIHRVFVGIPFARDKEYSRLTALSTRDEIGVKSRLLRSLLPPPFASMFSRTARNRRYLRKLLISVVREQRNSAATQGPNDELPKSSDVLSLILSNEASKIPMEDIATNVLNLSLTAHRALSSTLAHLFYNLASNPKWVTTMRDEVKNIVGREGWTRHSLDKMHKLDSFIKESMRMNGTPSLSTMRKTLQPFSFSDGICLPPHTFLASSARARHYDPSLYPSPATFSGFRFSTLREQFHGDGDGSGGVRFQLTTATSEYLAWGYGRHACPGRFFVGVVLKMIMGHVLVHYDVKFPEGVVPREPGVQMERLLSEEVKLLIRKRELD